MSTGSEVLDRPATLPTFDLHSVEEALKDNHVLFGGDPLTDAEIQEGIRAYREYLMRHKAQGMPEQFELPSLLVDRVWHTHMCETRQYTDDCIEYFGAIVHHSSGMCHGGGTGG